MGQQSKPVNNKNTDSRLYQFLRLQQKLPGLTAEEACALVEDIDPLLYRNEGNQFGSDQPTAQSAGRRYTLWDCLTAQGMAKLNSIGVRANTRNNSDFESGTSGSDVEGEDSSQHTNSDGGGRGCVLS